MNHERKSQGGTLPLHGARTAGPMATQISRDCRLMSWNGRSAIGSVMTGGGGPACERRSACRPVSFSRRDFFLWSEPGANFRPVRTICEPSWHLARSFINGSILRLSAPYLLADLVRGKFARCRWQLSGNHMATEKRQKTALSEKYAPAICEPDRELTGGHHA